MRVLWNATLATAALCVALICNVQPALACTGVYVGSDASADGTVIIARSSDTQEVWGNHVTLTDRVENKPGRQMPVDMHGTVMADLPATTYKYTAAPFMDSTMAYADTANDAGSCANEYGVAITLSVTAFTNDAALKADPLVENGLTENTTADLVICQSKTAREAVDVLFSLIDEYGSSECNIALIADQQEAWYVEMYSGHQYAAVKLPADRVCVFGNEFTMEYLSEFEESVVSDDLEQLAKEGGFAVYGENDELNLFDTYSGEGMTTGYSHMRTWIGHQVLAPSKFGDDYDVHERYPLCFEPDNPVGISDVCALLRNRFEGTEYSPDETGRIDMRVIGTDTALNVHALQVYPDLPAHMCCVTWESTGPAIYGAFIPVSNAVTSISESYGRNQDTSDIGTFDVEHYPYYAFKELSTLCVGPDNYQVYGQPVRAYWDSAEQGMFEGMQTVLSEASELEDHSVAEDYITGYCNGMQEQVFLDAKRLVNLVEWEQSVNSNTLKMMRNPETHQVTDEERTLDPIEIDLNASVYANIPEAPKQAA